MHDSGPLSSSLPIDQIKAGMRAAWIAGDFGQIAQKMEAPSEAFVASLALPAGIAVLDVACGTGNLTLPLARQGCRVTGVDIAPNLLAQARTRAAAEHLPITFDEGDAEQLPYPDAAFDAVVSMFGAMFAPRPERVAAELARVLRPDGLLALANWTPGSFSAQMFRTGARHVSPPPGLAPPVLWGDPAAARDRLAPFFTDIQTSVTPVAFDFPGSPVATVDFFREHFGPTRVAFTRLDPAGQLAFHADLVELWSSANTAPDPCVRTLIPNEFLRITARRSPASESASRSL